MKIVVTGATGFIGRRLMRRMVQTYDPKDIICLVNEAADNELETTGRALLDDLGVAQIPVDLLSGRGLDRAPKSPDIVFHLASNTDTGDHDHSINPVGTRRLLDAIGPLGLGAHFVFTSTISASDHREHADLPGDEKSELLIPYSEYGRSKLLTEKFLKDRCAEGGFALTIVRVCAVHGTSTRKGGLYDALIQLAKTNSILGRLNYPGAMAMIYVEDMADVLVRLSQLPNLEGPHQTFIPSGEVLTIEEMSGRIYEALGKPMKTIHLPLVFWWFVRALSQVIYAAEPFIPHGLYNRVWQLTLLANNGYNNRSVLMDSKLPGKEYRQFRATVREMLSGN